MATILDRYRVISLPDSCGGDLTKAKYTGLTPARFEAMATTEYNLARVIAESAEARAVGVVHSSLYELLTSRIKEVDKGDIQERKVAGQSIILPYTYRQRKTNILPDVFSVTAGSANPGAGVGGVPASAWDITIGLGPSWLQSPVTNLERYFLPGEFVYIENVNSAGTKGTNRDVRVTPFKVIASVNLTSTTAKLTVAANRTDTGWGTMSAAEKAVYQPTFGVIRGGTNSVHDMESWCKNQASDMSRSLLVDWHQTSRYTVCHNDVFDDTLDRVLAGDVNEFLKKFQYIPLTEQNKQQRAIYERKWMYDVLFGDVIDENQTPETYASLPQVVDPDDGTVYGYKSRALGLRTLLKNEGQVVDMHGGDLDLAVVVDLARKVKYTREMSGENVEKICFMTDKDTATKIDLKVLAYLKSVFGYNITQFYKGGEILDGTGVRFTYKEYELPGVEFKIAIFIHKYFTDRITFFGDGTGGAQGSVNFKEGAKALWAIDWSDFNIGIVGTNSAKREYRGKTMADANPLFSCVITPNTKHYELRSTTWTTQLGDAKRSLVIENFDGVKDIVL